MTARRKAALLLLTVVGALVAFGLGRISAGHPGGSAPAGDRGYAAGVADGRVAGRAQGVQEGRALQEGLVLPSDAGDVATSAFNAGYAAGASDVFGGYDGGWSLGAPYVITLAAGTGGATYRIASRTPMAPDTDYYLCPGHPPLCQQPR
jgi:hypothetical protein